MVRLNAEQQTAFSAAVRAARAVADFTGLYALYADLAAEITAEKPRCEQSGRCCRFDEYGHLLFVTPLEVAAFLEGLVKVKPVDAGMVGSAHPTLPILNTGCQFQVEGLCSVHEIRPFGCQIYFCDPRTTGWMQGAYERFHARIRGLHEAIGVPYLYVEWRAALAAVAGT